MAAMSGRTCKWVEAHVDDYLAGGLTPSERERVELHIATCFDCSDALDTWSFLRGAVPMADMPPMSELTERRILSGTDTKSLRIPSRRSPKGIYIGISAVAASIAAVAVLWFASAGGEDTVRLETFASVDEIEPQRPFARQPIEARSVEVDSMGRKAINVFPGTTLRFDPDAEVEVVGISLREARFRVSKGYAVAKIGKVTPGFRFIVETPEREVIARGTVFSVNVDEAGQSQVRVAEGAVEVHSRDGFAPAQLVVSGEQLEPWAKRPDMALPEALSVDLAASVGEKETAADSAEVPVLAVVRERPKGPNPKSEDTVVPVDTTGPDLMLKLAQQFRRSGEHRSAADVYAELLDSHPDSSEAQIVLVAFGQLRLNVLHDPHGALALFDRYLEAHPSGSLRSAALSGRVRTLSRLGQYAEVIASANTFLTEFPGGPASLEIRRRRGEAFAANGSCENAVADFRVIIEKWPDSAEASRARQGIVRCDTP